MKISNDITTLLSDVHTEFKNLEMKKDVDPRSLKESFNIFKQPNGEWFKSTKEGLHEAAVMTSLDFSKMPALFQLTKLIDEADNEFCREGGRIFITEAIVFKIVKGTTQNILVSKSAIEKKAGRYQKLCDEINDNGLNKDRYRVEETYILTRSIKGEWSMNFSHENHSGSTKILDLEKMPQLKVLAMKIYKFDPQFKINGGRIFVTSTRVYRVKNKVEIDFKF
ncbi:MAG: hypothetical protein K2Q18_06400 [Bdellovibrionales bacterium]|nr:hypothetical protein [Bdellovibrionales bacterium]